MADRRYESALLLPKSLSYPDSAYESLVTAMQLAAGYFAEQQDGQSAFSFVWPLDQQAESDFFAARPYSPHTLPPSLDPWERLYKARYRLPLEWSHLHCLFLFARTLHPGDINFRLTVTEGANVDTIDVTNISITGNSNAGTLALGQITEISPGASYRGHYLYEQSFIYGYVVTLPLVNVTPNTVVTIELFHYVGSNDIISGDIRPLAIRGFVGKDF